MKIDVNTKTYNSKNTVATEDEVRVEILDAWKAFAESLPPDLKRAITIRGSKYVDPAISINVDVFDPSYEAQSGKATFIPDVAKLRAMHDAIKDVKEIPGWNSAVPLLSSLLKTLENPGKEIGRLRNLEATFWQYVLKMRSTFPEGRRVDFLYNGNPVRLDYVEYVPPEKRGNGDTSPENVIIGYHSFQAFEGRHLVMKQINQIDRVYTDEIRGKTLTQFLHEQKWLEATEDDLERYYKHQARAIELLRNSMYQQLVITDNFRIGSRDRYGDYTETDKSARAGGGKCILDVLTDKDQPLSRDFYNEWELPEYANGLTHFALPVFHLAHNTVTNVKPESLVEYVYNPNIADELIIPDDIRMLLDTLTDYTGDEADEFEEADIITGKTSATVGLLCGPPGVGKTLTAEVYAEKAKRPLYRMQSGFLGTTPDEITKNLKAVCIRANRWDCPILIDEVDAFIRARGFDIKQNAIVVAFLETLEYSNVTLFMTTNRGFNIDDAVFSRASAIVMYELPEEKERKNLWEVLTPHFFPELAKQEDFQPLISELARVHDNTSGRDIKMILRLARRYYRNNRQPFTAERFGHLVKFRRNPNNTVSMGSDLQRQLVQQDIEKAAE